LRDALDKLPTLTARLEPPPEEFAQLQLPLFRETLRGKARVRVAQNC
jgi:hypothetical protein